MANTQAPNGFQDWGAGYGTAPNFETTRRLIARTDAVSLFNGDPVVSLSTGYITRATAGAVQIAGIFRGCKYLSISSKRVVWKPYWPGTTTDVSADIEAYIVADPNAKFIVQAGGSTTPITLANVNNNANFTIGTGNTSNGISGAALDQTTIATTATLPFRIVGLGSDYLLPGVNGSDITTGYNTVIVAFNFQDFKSTTGI